MGQCNLLIRGVGGGAVQSFNKGCGRWVGVIFK